MEAFTSMAAWAVSVLMHPAVSAAVASVIVAACAAAVRWFEKRSLCERHAADLTRARGDSDNPGKPGARRE